MAQPSSPRPDESGLPRGQEGRGSALEQRDRGEQRGSRTRTVGELVERWLEWRQQVRPISPTTVANYRGAIDRYILPNLGRAMLHEVDAATLDTLYARVRATGGKCRHCWRRIRRGEPALRAGVRYRPRPGADEAVHEPDCGHGWPVSASAVREVHSVLSGAFKQAVVWGWTTHNPARLATPPTAGRAELIDKDTKTHAKRRVAVGAETVELLKAHRARQAAAALAAGAALPPAAYVFARSPDGSAAISPDGISHRFQELAAQLGIRARLHDLRHFMVTQLVAGVAKPERANGSKGKGEFNDDAPF